MKNVLPRALALTSLTTALLLFSGCADQQPRYAYRPPPPPPPYNNVPPLIERAEHEGFRTGIDDGARDAYNRWGYQPKHDRNFHDTPGYDPQMGPYNPYRDAFRSAYLRGYDKGFYRC